MQRRGPCGHLQPPQFLSQTIKSPCFLQNAQIPWALNVGVTGFAPATSNSRSWRSTRLSYTPRNAVETTTSSPPLVPERSAVEMQYSEQDGLNEAVSHGCENQAGSAIGSELALESSAKRFDRTDRDFHARSKSAWRLIIADRTEYGFLAIRKLWPRIWHGFHDQHCRSQQRRIADSIWRWIACASQHDTCWLANHDRVRDGALALVDVVRCTPVPGIGANHLTRSTDCA
jgi:hypothetical protein